MANRVVLGAFDGTYVLRVSKPGHNVLDTNLDPNNVVFDSRWSNTLNIHQKGLMIPPSGSAGNTYTFASWPTLSVANPIVHVFFSIYLSGSWYRYTVSPPYLFPNMRLYAEADGLKADYLGSYTYDANNTIRYICFKENINP